MRKRKAVLAVLLAVAMTFTFSGCTIGTIVGKVVSAVSDKVETVAAKLFSSKKYSGGFLKYNGHVYMLSDLGFTWAQAEAYCEKAGGHLVTIASQEEQDTVKAMLDAGAKNSYWLGAQDNKKTGKFDAWVTGETFEYTNWAEGQPDNYHETENSLMMFKGYSPGTWNDLNDDGTCYNNDSPLFGVDNLGLIIEWESEQKSKDAIIMPKGKFLEECNASIGKSSTSGSKSSSSGKSDSTTNGGNKTAKSGTTKSSGGTKKSSAASSGQSTKSKTNINKYKDLYTFLKIPENYHCQLVMQLNGETLVNGEYWYKDGKAKLNCSLGNLPSLGDFKTVSYFENNVLYTCLPSQNVAIKTDVGEGAFFDQSSLSQVVDDGFVFKGTKAVTIDGIQCTDYVFTNSGVTASVCVTNALEYIIFLQVDDGSNTTKIYFKDMDIGTVTNGDVLMVNSAHNYKKFDSVEDYSNYMIQQMMKGQ